jgi:hypothetical protein
MPDMPSMNFATMFDDWNLRIKRLNELRLNDNV